MNKIDKFSRQAFIGFSLITLFSIFFAIYTSKWFIGLLPVMVLGGILALADFKQLFYLLVAFIPLSMEIELPGGMGTDLPSEPLIVLLMVIYFFQVLSKPKDIPVKFMAHPLIILVGIHFVWIVVTVIFAKIPLIAFKFMLAKLWYIMVFIFMGFMVIKGIKQMKIVVWAVLIPLLFTILQSIVRHAAFGFSFDNVNDTLYPFYRNHVSYAALMSLFLPFVVFARSWFAKGSLKRFALLIGIAIILLGITFAYTRGAWLAIIVAAGFYVLVRFRLAFYGVTAGVLGLAMFITFMIHDNEYLEYSTDYKKTVYHEELLDHLKASMQRMDVSSAERVYRWIAGFRMSAEELGTGFGPGNFYDHYKSYTVNLFTTWVSDNQERSGIHNYYLMILVEQGLPGFIIFTILSLSILIIGQRIYHQTDNKMEQALMMAAILSTIIIYVQIMLSDLIEVDKVGSFFFINIALLVRQDMKNKGLLETETTAPKN